MRCAVFGCNSDNQSKNYMNDVKFFTFPKDNVLCKLWEVACCRADKINVKNARICSKHFQADDYERNLQQELLNYVPKKGRKLKQHAVPSLFLPKNKCLPSGKLENNTDGRKQRALKRKNVKLVKEIINTSETVNEEMVPIADATVDDASSVPEILPSCSKDAGMNTDLESQDLRKLEGHSKALKSIFTDRQIKKLENPHIRPIWSVEEISQAISIYSAGPRAYRLLLKKGYPFPAVSTLRSWIKKIKIVPGILKQVVNIIKQTEHTDKSKICILSFDESKVRKTYCYDKVNDETLKPYNYVQVAMLRGLVDNWKQPIFFDFDCSMGRDLLMNIIKHVENAGFCVCAIVSDLGGSNRRLHRDLQVDHNKPWFLSPSDGHKIYVLADVPHLLKLIRNHFLDYGFIINEQEINKEIIEKLINLTSESDLRIAYKISMEHLTVQGPQRQKVKLAAKLFSHTISQAINRCGSLGLFTENENWLECSNFFKMVNDWFDCLNVRVPEADNRDRIKAFGLSMETQLSILEEMTQTMLHMRVKGKSFMMPFQKGIIQTNNALRLLYEDLNQRFGLKYILTYRLNQDVLENFFGVMRAKGGLYDHPDCVEFKYRLRNYILGRNEGSLSVSGNTEEDKTPDGPTNNIGEILLSQRCLSTLANANVVENTDTQDESLDKLGQSEDDFVEFEDFFSTSAADMIFTKDGPTENIVQDEEDGGISDLRYDALEHLTGYICYKMKLMKPNTSHETSTFTWVNQLSEGGLIKPPPELVENMKKLEDIFNNVNGNDLHISKSYLKNLLNLSKNVNCDEKMKLLFFRSRMYFF